MSTPKLVTNPPQGSGLVPSLVDRHWEDLSRGKPGELIAVVALLQPVGTSQRRTKDGVHRTVTYEAVRLEPMRDTHDADNITWEVTRAYERRTSGGGAQTELPLHNSPAEQLSGLLVALDEWRENEGITVEDLDERWTSYFGGSEHAASSTVRAGSLLQLTEFARYVGAVSDPVVGKDDDGLDDPADDGFDDEPAADSSVPAPAFSRQS
jgi:hypothetical protein